jgi:WD40 repeat protein
VQFEWDTCLQTLEMHKDDIKSLVYSPDNSKLASFSEDGNVRMWDRATGACLQSLTFDTNDWQASMAFSPDNSQLALAVDDVIRLLDINAGARVTTLSNAPLMPSMSITYSLNGMQLMVSNELWEDSDFRIWDLTTTMQLQKEDYFKNIRDPAVFQLDTPGEGEITVIRSPITGSRVQVISRDRPKMVVFTLDGMQFALKLEAQNTAAKHPVSIYVLDASIGKCLQKFMFDSSWHAEHWTISPDGTQLATASAGDAIHVWDVKSSASLFTVSSHYVGNYTFPVFSPDSAELATVAEDQTIKLWDLTLGAAVPKKKKMIMSVAYSPDGTCLALITINFEHGIDFVLEIWDPAEGICHQQLPAGSEEPETLLDNGGFYIPQPAFSPDNSQLVYSTKRRIVILNLITGPPQDLFEFDLEASGSVQSIVFSPSGARLAIAENPSKDMIMSGTGTSQIVIWDMVNEILVYKFYSDSTIIGMYFSSDSGRLGSMAEDGTAALWDLNTGACLQTLELDSYEIFREPVEGMSIKFLWQAQSRNLITDLLRNPDSTPGVFHEFGLNSNSSWLLRRGNLFFGFLPNFGPAT